MRIDKGTLCSSPFIGVFSVVTEELALMPFSILPKEERKLSDFFGVEIIKTKLAESSLIGVMCAGIKKRFVVSELVLDSEIKKLEEIGVKVKRIAGVTAIGNLIKVNENGGIASRVLNNKQIMEIEKFLGIKLHVMQVASLDIVGSAVVASNRGFLVHPDVTKDEFKLLKEAFKVDGRPTTLNYGDKFVGNNAVANTNAILVGDKTTAFELIRVQDVFL
ncbi:MAG: translation initiation factor IF-6 [Candidatus Iainarchaeum archaeon]|uniref:Translation initiation factor IF-6 n=1 Tax=Candidatus Iainarchaeum sp. TaxID=3101447 RepID=A0A497JGW7_9ARCH|nr:MAG: translation initiation factor IF-6 [Candidatus Diapherotrites archaeon]